MSKILEAIEWANHKHEGQKRKGSGLPYITHPIAVSYILASYKKSKKIEDLIIACIAHDTLEDTAATFLEIAEMFGPLVASLVLELTNDEVMIEKIGKLEYHKSKLCGISSYALVIKLADRLHNISDNPSDKMISETEELMMHLLENRKLSKTQAAMVKEILNIIDRGM
jgi:(p)ppGpp synthase/HD superfamily hydrolase